MTRYRGLPPGPNVGTQLKAIKRKKALQQKASVGQEAEPLSHDRPLSQLTLEEVRKWFDQNGWRPFEFQEQTWRTMLEGKSGLLHATTGAGKTFAVWCGALLACSQVKSPKGAATQVIWVTPMRALAADTTKSLQYLLEALASDRQVRCQTGDTDSATRTAIKNKPPFGLVTTPESLTLMLTRQASLTQFNKIKVLVVDEWHELMGNKRGVQLQLAIARLVKINPSVQIWGLSATLGNLDQAMNTLLFPLLQKNTFDPPPALIQGSLSKDLLIDSLIPAKFERFPWGGHLGIRLVKEVVEQIDQSAGTCLIFTNTRSQAEIWFQALLEARPDFAGVLALHHGSLDKSVRDFVEQGLKQGSLKVVVCTSSLDLGVDFLPVERVLQVGSPKGVARLLQRAGRSGHAPGRPSRVTVVPTHALELMEAAAARYAVAHQHIECRHSPVAPLDVLVQHLVTVAIGGGFIPDELYAEVSTTKAYQDMSREHFDWVLAFVERGGESLKAYPDFQRIVPDEQGKYRVARRDIARRHVMSIGTIVSDSSMYVAWMKGGKLGTIEESFIARLKPGDCFSFAGRVLELVKVRDMTAYVRKADRKKAIVPNWTGGKMPLSNELAQASLVMLDRASELMQQGLVPAEPELIALQPLFETQVRWSVLPSSKNLVMEALKSKEGHHLFVYPFAGRMVNTGLASLLAWRLSQIKPLTFSISMNDYGFELLSAESVPWHTFFDGDLSGNPLFAVNHLLEDLIRCLNASELAQRRFREIARISGLVFQGYPGQGKSARQLQASSSLFFDVFKKYDPGNCLLAQAHQEALEQELEVGRMRQALLSMHSRELVFKVISKPTPFAFPLMIERLRETVSTEALSSKVARMVADLEKAAQC